VENTKIIVVTGASHGLGLAISRQLISHQHTVLMVSRNEKKLKAAIDGMNTGKEHARPFVCDISDETAVRAIAGEISRQYENIDVLINNAGIPAPRTFAETSFEDWNTVIGTNLSAVFFMTKSLWAPLAAGEGGYVINISGTAGKRGGSSPGYGSAKFGLTGLTHAIAASGKDENIRATVLYPGSMDTGWRGAQIGVKPAEEIMDPKKVAELIEHLILTPREFVLNEAVLNPIANPFL
jgi:NAD(P)-dependent dehydrogenase (short-subunit alcohol dehydrogenase family)